MVIFETNLFWVHVSTFKNNSIFMQQVWFSVSFLRRIYTWLHCSEFPQSAGNFAKPRTSLLLSYCTRTKKNYLPTIYQLTLSLSLFSSMHKISFSPANFCQAVALSFASQHLQKTNSRPQYKLHLTCTEAHWQLIPSITGRVWLKVTEMRAWASPQVLPSKRPASDKGKLDRSSRSLSSLPLFLYVSLPLSAALCSSLSADAPTTAATFNWKYISKMAPGV